MERWRDFGVVETIYEEEQEDLSNSPSPLTPTTSNSVIFSLRSIVEEWSKATGLETDILVYVHGRCFHLHKDPLVLRSRHLLRYLTESKEKSVYLPSCITAETFALVACFCYSSDVVITPFNIVALRIASEVLDMTEEEGDVDRNLLQITESYFRHAVAVNTEYATIVLRSCLSLLPEAEETGFLLSRCIEALVLTDGVDRVNDGLVDGVKSLTVEEFQMIVDSMKGRFTRNHDLLYKVVDLYLEEHESKVTEEEKNRICCPVDCNKLSQHLLMHAIQNPKMPLRFVIRAMMVEQLNTRQSISMVSADHHSSRKPHNNKCATLGAILQRDAALRYTIQLKETMEATSARIIRLEHELTCMKKQMHMSENKREALDSTRSASCRFSWEDKGDRGEKAAAATAMEKTCITTTPRSGKRLSRKLMSGLKNVFRMSKTTDSVTGNLDASDGDIGVIDMSRSHSLV